MQNNELDNNMNMYDLYNIKEQNTKKTKKIIIENFDKNTATLYNRNNELNDINKSKPNILFNENNNSFSNDLNSKRDLIINKNNTLEDNIK